MIFLVWKLNGPRVDRQRVYVPAHEFSGGSIDHPMTLHLRHPGERRSGNGHVEMTPFAGARMSNVLVAVIADFEQRGMQGRLQRCP